MTDQNEQKRRSTARYEIPGTMVLCARKWLLGFWRNDASPFHVNDVGCSGLSFRNFGARLRPGTPLRLTLLLPGKSPIVFRAEVIWNKEQPTHGACAKSTVTHLCGVKFTDYTGEAWSALSQTLAAFERKQCVQKSGAETTAVALDALSTSSPASPQGEPSAYHPAEISLAPTS